MFPELASDPTFQVILYVIGGCMALVLCSDKEKSISSFFITLGWLALWPVWLLLFTVTRLMPKRKE